jgi:ubiquinone/menaquinone biosynthesis C-methylase UbiE
MKERAWKKVPARQYNLKRILGEPQMEKKGYVLGQSPIAARRLELQDRYFGEPSERLLDMLALRPSDLVVELGCGPGSFSHRVLNRLGEGGLLRGVDSSEGLLEEARTLLAKVGPAKFETILGDASKLGPWLSGADAVVGRLVLHHIPMMEFLLGRLRTVLRPGTRLGFLEPDVRTPQARMAHVQATTRPDLMPLLVWAASLNQLFLHNRISPEAGATLAQTLDLAGYRNIRSEWSPNPPNALMIENMVMLYDEVRDKLGSLGILSPEEVTEQQRLLRALSLAGVPPVWGSFRVVCEV